MIQTLTLAAKYKAVLAALAVLLSGVGLYEVVGDNPGISPAAQTIDPFTKDIQERSDIVYNAVSEAVNQQGKQSPLIYKQTCESSMSFIRSERLDTNNQYNTLDSDQKELIEAYRAYLEEAANVVIVCYSGEAPDLTAMYTLKAQLY